MLQRYARGFERLVREAALPAIVICHDQAIRYLENVLAGDDPLFGPVQEIPNATPYAYSGADIALGAERLVSARVGVACASAWNRFRKALDALRDE